MKTEYRIYEFNVKEVQKAQDWLNNKAQDGFVVINIHYYNNLEIQIARYTLERKEVTKF